MAENKKSFVLYSDLISVVEKLVFKDRENKTNYGGELFLHILKYVNDQEPIAVDFIIEMAFEPIKLQLKRDLEKSNRGSNHWNWKNGVSKNNHKIRNSASMKEWRIEVFKKDIYTCQHCTKRGGKLNAHHIKPFSCYPSLRFEISNGLTLCEKCHINEHKRLRYER